MKKYIYILVVCALFLFIKPVYAHPGDNLKDASGCHHCWTNCAQWGLYYGQFHCHNSQTLLPTYYCHTYQSAQKGCKIEQDYQEFYNTHVIPLLSVGESLESAEKTFNYQLQQCEQQITQNKEYEKKYQECQTSYEQQVKQISDKIDKQYEFYTKSSECLKTYGINAIYDEDIGYCSCKEGYKINEELKKCVIRDICNESDSHSLTMMGKCYCFSNYLVDPDTKKCTEADIVCKKVFDNNSYYDQTSEKCVIPTIQTEQTNENNNQIKNDNDNTIIVEKNEIMKNTDEASNNSKSKMKQEEVILHTEPVVLPNKINNKNINTDNQKPVVISNSVSTTNQNMSIVENIKNIINEDQQDTNNKTDSGSFLFSHVVDFFKNVFSKLKFW